MYVDADTQIYEWQDANWRQFTRGTTLEEKLKAKGGDRRKMTREFQENLSLSLSLSLSPLCELHDY